MKSSEPGTVPLGDAAEERREHLIVPRVHVRDPADLLATTLRGIRETLQLAESFPPEVEAEAEDAVTRAGLPEADQTEIPFVTIDPAGSTDLDQAVHLERAGEGYRVRYAIADVPSFVAPGGAVDAEARRRGQTIYAPDGRIPLHPVVISEHAASLLEGQVRGAFVWTFELDAAANVTTTSLERARVSSRHQLSYEQVQKQLDDGTAEDWLVLLKEVGLKRELLERERGGASLNRPDEEVEFVDNRYTLVRRMPLPVEGWNAQVSLMTGMAAAQIMIDGRIGILRTMPAPWPDTIAHFRTQVAALGCPWPESQGYGEYLRSLDQADPRSLAVIHAAATLFRGAGYTAFEGEVPHGLEQAAVGASYTHATAPLRRLVDRFVLVTCAALVQGKPVPQWVREALPTLPKIMSASDGIASRLEHASVDAIEAALLQPRVGEVFDAVVISTKQGTDGTVSGGSIQLADPAVTAPISGAVVAGQPVKARLVTVEIATGTVQFALVAAGATAEGR
ncbi:RNB domain-containing ribonuclease [soil metagenome]